MIRANHVKQYRKQAELFLVKFILKLCLRKDQFVGPYVSKEMSPQSVDKSVLVLKTIPTCWVSCELALICHYINNKQVVCKGKINARFKLRAIFCSIGLVAPYEVTSCSKHIVVSRYGAIYNGAARNNR